MESEQRRAAAAAVREAMDAHNLEPLELAALAQVSVDTVRDFLAGRRWPRTAKRNAIERQLGWPQGRIALIARQHTPERGDPVQVALEQSPLPAEDRLAVLNLYMEKLYLFQQRHAQSQ